MESWKLHELPKHGRHMWFCGLPNQGAPLIGRVRARLADWIGDIQKWVRP